MVRVDIRVYPAEASLPGFAEGQTTTGSLTVIKWSLRFESPGLACEIPPPRLLINEGENGEIIFTDREQPALTIWTNSAEILSDHALLQHTVLRSQIRAIRSQVDGRKSLKLIAWFVGAFVVLAMLGTSATRLMVRSLVNRIPADWEQELGETTMQEIQREYVFSTNKHLKVVLEKSVKPLVSALPKGPAPYQFYVLEWDMPNAFALPGGHVVVTSGLLYLLEEKPEEIAGVVAHEIAHQTQRHLWRKVISSVGPYVIFTMFAGDGPLRLLSDSYHALASQSFSQEYELEADSVGWDYLVTARIDPRGLASSLTKLKGYYSKFPEATTGVQALSSHPATDKRIRRLQVKWDKLKKKDQFHTFDLTEKIEP